MKKNRVIKRQSPLRVEARLGRGFGKMSANTLKSAHPVVKASYLWGIISTQLLDVLGPEIYHQWFQTIRPVVITDGTLVLEASNHFAAQWIHRTYQELVDLLLSVHDPEISALFLSKSDRAWNPKTL